MIIIRLLWKLFLVLFLTALTQLGGVAYILAHFFRRRFQAFCIIYLALSIAAIWAAPFFGRQPLTCFGAEGLRMQSPLLCVLNRHYVSDDMMVLADKLGEKFPHVRALDANFPFVDGFPLLPHLSHDDGDKLDLAFVYDGPPPSPVGYWAFVDGPSTCPHQPLSLRWDMTWLQGLWRDSRVDVPRTTELVNWLTAQPAVGKRFLEPHLVRSGGLSSPKIRFQGCQAGRHDDHIHIQL